LDLRLENPKTEIIETKPLASSNVRIEEADYIVTGGRGLERKDDIALLEDLAKTIGGQVGFSRTVG